MHKNNLLTTRQAAAMKSVCPRTITAAVARGEMHPVVAARGRRGYVFREEDVRAWVPPCELPRHRYSDEELLALLAEARHRLGRLPVGRDVPTLGRGFPAVTTFAGRFGSWRRAKTLAEQSAAQGRTRRAK